LTEKLGIRQAVFGVSGIVIISKFLGFIREMAIAERFGTSFEYDIYLIAIAAPVFFNVVVVRAINNLSVPMLTARLNGEDPEKDRHSVWSIFNSLALTVLAIIASIIIFAPEILHLIKDELTGEDFNMAVTYCRLGSFLVIFGFLESFLRSALNVKKHFVYPVTGVIILNIVIISSIYLFSSNLSVGAILLGLISGYSIQVVFLLLKLWDISILKSFNLRLFNPDVRLALKAGGAIIAVELLTSTYFLIDRYFASDFETGVVSAFNYSSLLVLLPVTVIGFAVAAVVFPYLSERSGEDRKKDFSTLLKSSLSLALVIGLPSGIFYFMFAREVAAAVFLRGAFDLASLDLTSSVLEMLAPYLGGLFVYTILIQACYSSNMQKTVFYIAFIAIILKLGLTWILKDIIGYPGIALATSIVKTIVVSILIIVLFYKGRLFGLGSLFRNILKILIASIPILIIGYYYQGLPDFSDNMGSLSKYRAVWAAIGSIIGFLAVGYLIKIDEIKSIVNGLVKKK